MSENYAAIGTCSRCDAIVVCAQWQGLKVCCRTVSVPHRDAEVLMRYGVPVWRIFIEAAVEPVESEYGYTAERRANAGRLVFSEWHSSSAPATGRLYVEHICGLRP